MSSPRSITVAALLVCAGICILLLPEASAAQCAMCRATVTAAANNAAMIKKLNLGILVMLVPPVTIFCSIFIVALKYRKGRFGDESSESD